MHTASIICTICIRLFYAYYKIYLCAFPCRPIGLHWKESGRQGLSLWVCLFLSPETKTDFCASDWAGESKTVGDAAVFGVK